MGLQKILALELDGGKWSGSCPSCYTLLCPRRKISRINQTGGWEDPSVDIDAVKKNLARKGIEPGPSCPFLYRLSYPVPRTTRIASILCHLIMQDIGE
jgi:hypothetical protein